MANQVFVGVEGALIQTKVTLNDEYPSVLDDLSDSSVELGFRAGYDFGDYRVWGGYAYRTKGSEDVDYKNGGDYLKGEFSWTTHNILVGADYTPTIAESFKLVLGAYTGISFVKGEFEGSGHYTRWPYTYTLSSDSVSGTGALIGAKVGGLYAINDNNEIKLGVKADYQSTGIEDFDNATNYGVYLGYNYKF